MTGYDRKEHPSFGESQNEDAVQAASLADCLEVANYFKDHGKCFTVLSIFALLFHVLSILLVR